MQKLKFAFAGGLTLIALSTLAAPAQAYQCRNEVHQAVGVRPTELVARYAARKGWSNTAKAAFGLSWSVWKIAKNKGISCARLNSGKWRCISSARPCNYVVP